MGLRRLLAYFRRRPEERPPIAAFNKSRQMVQEAIRGRRQMVAFHGKQWLVFSPHVIRDRAGGPHVLAYLLCGRPYLEPQGGGPSQRWVWLPLGELWGLDARGDAEEAVLESAPRFQAAR
jgi:hypothetical protein